MACCVDLSLGDKPGSCGVPAPGMKIKVAIIVNHNLPKITPLHQYKDCRGLLDPTALTTRSPVTRKMSMVVCKLYVCMSIFVYQVLHPETGKSLGPREEGELWIKSPLRMQGYMGDPAASAELVDAAGFLRSGDIGYYDEQGYFYIVDRLKELIKYKGFQVCTLLNY